MAVVLQPEVQILCPECGEWTVQMHPDAVSFATIFWCHECGLREKWTDFHTNDVMKRFPSRRRPGREMSKIMKLADQTIADALVPKQKDKKVSESVSTFGASAKRKIKVM